MKKTLLIAIFSILAVLLPFACKKETFKENEEPISTNSSQAADRSSSHEFYSGGSTLSDENDAVNKTMLGNVRPNPYTVANFTAAYNTLYEPDIPSLPTTHYYVKFLPATQNDVVVLAKSDLNLYEYALDREVIKMGNAYKEAGTPASQLIPFYAVVRAGQSLPNIPYQNLANLHLGSMDERLVRAALQRLGYNPDVIGYIMPDDPGDGSGGGGGGTAELQLNACGCQVYKEQRKPGGCIQVRDVEKGVFEGVKNVKVIIKDTWFTEVEAWTDDNGCFRINNRHYGQAWMWVRYRSDRVQVRGARSSFDAVWEWAFPIKDYVGVLDGPVFNNIEVRYDMWNNQGSAAHLQWGAATVNNAVNEFISYAIADGINPPPPFLDIYVGRNHDYGYALMSSQTLISQAVFTVLIQTSYFAGPFGPLIAVIGASVVQAYLPDIYVGIDYRNSDRLKWLAYHEIAHASHWTNVGGSSYWDNVVNAEVFAGGHGSFGSQNAGLISLVESWADHIGTTYADRTYGGSTSIGETYLARLETSRNESANHIPIGFYHDLFDTAADTQQACNVIDGGCGPINDMASGFTNAQMFALMDASTISPIGFRDRLIQGSSTTTQIQVGALFNSYVQ